MADRAGKLCKLVNPLNSDEKQARFLIVEDNGTRLQIEIINKWRYRELVAEGDISIIGEGNHGIADRKI